MNAIVESTSAIAPVPAADAKMVEQTIAAGAALNQATGNVSDAGATPVSGPPTVTATEKFIKATAFEEKKAAYAAMTQDEKNAVRDSLSAELRKAIGMEEPEKAYAPFKLPQGITYSEDALKGATALFQQAGLSQEQAQGFIDLAAAREKAVVEGTAKTFVDLQHRWIDEIKADREIGGDRFDASVATAKKAIEKLNIPGLKEALHLTGAGNNPAIVKAFVQVGRMMTDKANAGLRSEREMPLTPSQIIYSNYLTGDQPELPPPTSSTPRDLRTLAEIVYGGNPKGSTDGL